MLRGSDGVFPDAHTPRAGNVRCWETVGFLGHEMRTQCHAQFDPRFCFQFSATLQNMPTSDSQAHSFGPTALIDLSIKVFDGAGTKTQDIGFAGNNSNLVDVIQRRSVFGPNIQVGSNDLQAGLNALDLTGLSATTGFLDINLSVSPFISFGGGADVFVANLLFDDPASLLSNIQLGLPIARANLDDARDPAVFGLNSTLMGNFLFDSISVSQIVVDPVDPPVNPVLLRAGCCLRGLADWPCHVGDPMRDLTLGRDLFGCWQIRLV